MSNQEPTEDQQSITPNTELPVGTEDFKSSEDETRAQSQEEAEDRPWYKRTLVKVGAGVLVVAATAATVAGLYLSSKSDGNFSDPNGEKTPGIDSPTFLSPEDPDYDPFAKIGSNSDLSISSIDRLAGFFTSPEVSREALIKALSQANQEEVDRILEVIDDYESGNNSEITTILNKYGLETSEVPVNPLGRISEKNDFTEQEFNTIMSDFYQGLSYDSVRNALENFSQSDIDTVRDVVNGEASSKVLDNLMRSYGVEIAE